MKSRLRSAIAMMAARSGILSACEFLARDGLTILCYHRVLPSADMARYHDPFLVVTPETFRDHCRILAERYRVEPLDRALSLWRAGRGSERPLAAITFDDGYRDNLHYAVPILSEFSLRASFYIVAGLVDTQEPPWYDVFGTAWNALAASGRQPSPLTCREALALAKKKSPDERAEWLDTLKRMAGELTFYDNDMIVNSDQLRRLSVEGHEIGSHTMLHPILTQCDDATLRTELEQSRAILSQIIGKSVTGLSYPNGDADARVRAAASQAGYDYATSAIPGVNGLKTFDALAAKRWFISQDRLSDGRGRQSDALMRMEVCGLAHRLFQRSAGG